MNVSDIYFASPNLQRTVLPKGSPVANHAGGNGIVSAVSPSAMCVGLLSEDGHINSLCVFQLAGDLELEDWTVITGTPELLPNTVYYLSTVAGRLTSTVPPVAQIIGTSVSPTVLSITIGADPNGAAIAASLTNDLMLMGG